MDCGRAVALRRTSPTTEMAGMRSGPLALHAGCEAPDPATGAVAVPIYQRVADAFDSAGHGAALLTWNPAVAATLGLVIPPGLYLQSASLCWKIASVALRGCWPSRFALCGGESFNAG
jgi:hypothetical protein